MLFKNLKICVVVYASGTSAASNVFLRTILIKMHAKVIVFLFCDIFLNILIFFIMFIRTLKIIIPNIIRNNIFTS